MIGMPEEFVRMVEGPARKHIGQAIDLASAGRPDWYDEALEAATYLGMAETIDAGDIEALISAIVEQAKPSDC